MVGLTKKPWALSPSVSRSPPQTRRAPSGLADFDVIEDAVHLAGGDLRAHLGGGVERIAEAEFAGARGKFLDEAIVNVFVEQQARSGGAHFALVAEDAPERGAHGGVEIGVGEDDVGRLAAEFQAEALEVGDGGVLQELARGGDAAGEADLIDILVQGEGFAGGLAVAGDDDERALGETGLRRRFRRSGAR